MKIKYWIPALLLALCYVAGVYLCLVKRARELDQVRFLINYAADTPTTEDGGQALRQHLVIGAVTNILVEPGRLSVYGRKGSRIWYYPEAKTE